MVCDIRTRHPKLDDLEKIILMTRDSALANLAVQDMWVVFLLSF